MQRMLRPTAFAALVLAAGPTGATPADDPAVPVDPVQIVADVTLIDAECRNVRVAFGPAIGILSLAGIRLGDVLPKGSLRDRFEADYKNRFETTSHDDLCGEVVTRYGTKFPGLFTAP